MKITKGIIIELCFLSKRPGPPLNISPKGLALLRFVFFVCFVVMVFAVSLLCVSVVKYSIL